MDFNGLLYAFLRHMGQGSARQGSRVGLARPGETSPRVHRALGRAGADQGVQLVDEEDVAIRVARRRR